MSARVFLGTSLVLLASMPVVASLNRVETRRLSLAEMFATPQNYATPLRMERTPRMDGVFRRAEWDVLWGGPNGDRLDAGKVSPPPPVIINKIQEPAPMTGPIGATPPGGPATQPPVTPPVAQPTTPPTSPATQPTNPPVTPPTTPATQPPANKDQGTPPVPTSPIKPPSTDPYGTKPTPPPTPAPAPAPLPTPTPNIPTTPPAHQDGNSPLVPTVIQPTTQAVRPPEVTTTVTPMPTAPATPVVAPEPDQSALMSWEPGKLYFGGILRPGNDLLISIDAGNDGFQSGRDNLEIRVTSGSTPTVKARILDATSGNGPSWIDAPGFTASCTAVSTVQPDGTVFVEVAVVDPGYEILDPKLDAPLGIRVDSIPATEEGAPANLPRATTEVVLADHRVTDLPGGLDIAIGDKGRSVLAGSSTTVRWEVSSGDGDTVKSFDVSGEGNLENKVNTLSIPNPLFDQSGAATIEYPTRVLPSTPAGYGVLKAKVYSREEAPAEVESSLRVAPALDIVAPSVRLKPEMIKNGKAIFGTNIVSNTDQRVQGSFQVVAPEGWRVTDGNDKNFYIYNKGSLAKRQFVVQVPEGAHGTYKFTLRVVALGGVSEQPLWVTIP